MNTGQSIGLLLVLTYLGSGQTLSTTTSTSSSSTTTSTSTTITLPYLKFEIDRKNE